MGRVPEKPPARARGADPDERAGRAAGGDDGVSGVAGRADPAGDEPGISRCGAEAPGAAPIAGDGEAPPAPDAGSARAGLAGAVAGRAGFGTRVWLLPRGRGAVRPPEAGARPRPMTTRSPPVLDPLADPSTL